MCVNSAEKVVHKKTEQRQHSGMRVLYSWRSRRAHQNRPPIAKIGADDDDDDDESLPVIVSNWPCTH